MFSGLQRGSNPWPLCDAMITSLFHSFVRNSHNIPMFHSFHAYDEFNKLACSQRMGLHSSVGGALQR